MELLVVKTSTAPVSWVREFGRLETDWCAGVAEPVHLAGGTLFSSTEFPESTEANSIGNAWLPPGSKWSDLSAELFNAFAVNGTRCRRCWLNPSMPSELTDPVDAGLTAAGWRAQSSPLLRWTESFTKPEPVRDLMIVPARSAFAALAEFAARRGDRTAVAHLDDPQVDSWVALSSGRVSAVCTVQISGKTAVLRDWHVEPEFRGRGLGKAILNRATDLCWRAEVAGVLAVTDNDRAITAGFSQVGQWTRYHPPA